MRYKYNAYPTLFQLPASIHQLGQGLILPESIKHNVVLASMKKFSRGLFLNYKEIEEASEKNISDLKIKTPSADERAGQLSGGNQQKVVVGKWVNTNADIYIFDEPTRGIDVGAKIEVYNVMNQLVHYIMLDALWKYEPLAFPVFRKECDTCAYSS